MHRERGFLPHGGLPRAAMATSGNGRPARLPLAAVLGVSLVVIAPVLWVGLGASHLWESQGPPTPTASGYWSGFWGNSGQTVSNSAVFDSAGESVVLAFRNQGFGAPGAILFLEGPGLTERFWVDPDCNPMAMADDSSSADVVILCQDASLNWELLPVGTQSQKAMPALPLPTGETYSNQVAIDAESGIAYLVQQPPNQSSIAFLIGVRLATGALVSNITVSFSDYAYGSSMALGPSPGTLFWMDRQTGIAELLNSTTGAVQRASAQIGEHDQSIYFDPSTSDLFLPSGGVENTTILSSSNMSVIAVLPDSSCQFGVQTDSAHQETYLYGFGVVTVVKTGEWGLVGSIPLPGWADSTTYDPVTDQFAGGVDSQGGGPAAEITSISRSPIHGAAFSSVPLLGASLPGLLALTSLLAGLAFLARTRKAIVAAHRERKARRDREFTNWMNEPSVEKWNGDQSGDQPRG